MKKIQFALSIMALTVALCFASQSVLAQSASDSARNPTAQQQPVQPNDQPAAVSTASEKMFEGTIVKAGDKFVLTATDSKTTFQLHDQHNAQHFANNTVKSTRVLDPSTETLRFQP